MSNGYKDRRSAAISFGFVAYFASQVVVLLGGWLVLILTAIRDTHGIFEAIYMIPLTIFMCVLWIPGTILNAVLAPPNCLFSTGIFSTLEEVGQCSLSEPLGIINYAGLGGFIVLTVYGYFLMPNQSGVPILYRWIAFFTRSRSTIASDVSRATASERAGTFDAKGLFNRMDREPTNAYDEILEREDIEKASKAADDANKRFNKREAELRGRQAEKLDAAERLAKAMEEVERAKARVNELDKEK